MTSQCNLHLQDSGPYHDRFSAGLSHRLAAEPIAAHNLHSVMQSYA